MEILSDHSCKDESSGDSASGGCACGCGRREFLVGAGAALGGIALGLLDVAAAESEPSARPAKQGATVRVAFLFPPSTAFSEKPEGWWSWPGNDYGAEARQKQYLTQLQKMEKKLGVKIAAEEKSIASNEDAQRLAQSLETDKPDGLLLVMFYNNSLPQADLLLKAADKLGIPAIFYIGLGVKHGPITPFRRPGVYFIQSLENFEAIEYGLRMINAKKLMSQSKLLSVTEAPQPREGIEAFFGIKVRVIPFANYADEFQKVVLGKETRRRTKAPMAWR
ncbi:MAG: hypothetical protein NTX50_09955 [Candidatus Sumerlaeota bacterium]|nr:hypothetical protein [Candidatus Sumerlaeota bacterium]